MKFSIVLPCYNESRNLPLIAERMAPFGPRYDFELILVNNGSTDDSSVVLDGLEKQYADFLRVVTVIRNIGYGHGILTGLKEAKGDVLLYSHADIQTPPEDIFKAIDLLREKKLDMERVLIKGRRVNRRPDEQFLTNGLGKVVQFTLGYPLADINGQPKMFHRSFLNMLNDAPFDFTFDVYVMYMARVKGLALETFPVDFGTRVHGESKWAANAYKKYLTIFKYLLNIFRIAKRNFHEERNVFKQLSKFLATGALNTGVSYVIFYVLLNLFGIYYVVSSVVGYMTGFVVSFLINRTWTFKAKGGGHRQQFLNYFYVNIVSLSANVVVIYALTEGLRMIPEISQIFALMATTAINFTGAKLWVFKHK